ncbi:MAG: polysaccharide deacetylase family protein [Polyangiaceae bacterium]
MRTAFWLAALFLALLGAGPARASACNVAADQGGSRGIYRTDPVPAGEAMLTFDDGPLATATPRVLDMLAEHRMKAAFFVVGRNISRSTYRAVQRMVAEGHTVGSHCYTHDVHMTRVSSPEETVRTIRSQHEVTAVLIDLALLAASGDDFDVLYRRVLESEPGHWMSATRLRRDVDDILQRHRALLLERGFGAGRRPYPVVYARPPGGGPYEERGARAGVALYDAALEQLRMINVMWHGGAGDTDPQHGHDPGFLTSNLGLHARRGGVLLVHDEILPEALAASLRRIAADPTIRVVTLDDAIRRKYGCQPRELATSPAH